MTDELESVADAAARAGIRRVHALAWRDLEDETAGGSERHVNELLTRWADAGLDVVLHAGRVDGRPPIVRRHGVEVRRGGGTIASWAVGAASVLAHVDRRRDALVEVWHGVNWLAPLWSRVPTIGIFHHVHTAQFSHVLPAPLASIAQTLERRVYPRVYRGRPLIALSNSVRDEMVRQLGWDASAVHVVEPGVAESFVPGTPSPIPLVVAVGRFMPQKAFGAAVDVLVRAKRDCDALEAILVGDGPEWDAVVRKVEDAGASSWLRLPGRVDDGELLALYQRAWVLLSTSRREGWGMTVTEAAACRVPAVATRITGHVEAVVPGETGILATTVDDLATALVLLLADDTRRARMGAAAADHAAQYRWDTTARRVFDVLAAEAERFWAR